ncbi:hypothetical protein [Bosea sp. BIWAKO-01]|uniref:hypothetical protein n=1 Tax=Bosea sp. BIWAKO-01 TaxID=506668 RepID=UPI0008535488|nr:hypothetical protein [Bosea sp. BIWAKO-01]GAU86004.1 hypothetical protein BIWAKO_05952 [Bosea sp. BIWAKO-01]
MKERSPVGIPDEAILSGPQLDWRHVDGPAMWWDTDIHWLTRWECLKLWLHLTTADELACSWWPTLALRRFVLLAQRAAGEGAPNPATPNTSTGEA